MGSVVTLSLPDHLLHSRLSIVRARILKVRIKPSSEPYDPYMVVVPIQTSIYVFVCLNGLWHLQGKYRIDLKKEVLKPSLDCLA
ncbi:MAG: hypothetical protein QW220_01850 [Candidatus Bathyarchaeia archaeon]